MRSEMELPKSSIGYYVKKDGTVVLKSTDFVENGKLVQGLDLKRDSDKRWFDNVAKECVRKALKSKDQQYIYTTIYIDFRRRVLSLEEACEAVMLDAVGAIRDLLILYDCILKELEKRGSKDIEELK